MIRIRDVYHALPSEVHQFRFILRLHSNACLGVLLDLCLVFLEPLVDVGQAGHVAQVVRVRHVCLRDTLGKGHGASTLPRRGLLRCCLLRRCLGLGCWLRLGLWLSSRRFTLSSSGSSSRWLTVRDLSLWLWLWGWLLLLLSLQNKLLILTPNDQFL